MIRQESDREDLLAETMNLPQRGRITDVAENRVWVIGWRKDTAVSLFDDVDPVFQFNATGELRRVYLDGQKLAADKGGLKYLQKKSGEGTQLAFEHVPLTDEQHEEVQQRLAASLQSLLAALSKTTTTIETVGIDTESFTKRVKQFCETPTPVVIAAVPNVAG